MQGILDTDPWLPGSPGGDRSGTVGSDASGESAGFLSLENLWKTATERRQVALDTDDRLRMDEAAEFVTQFATTHPVYGRTTGVGANRCVSIDAHQLRDQDLRLLRSHATGASSVADDDDVRMMLLVRLRQLCRGGSGLDSRVAEAIVETLEDGDLPVVHTLGSLGTGDLSALAEVALTLAGELPTRSGRTVDRWQPRGGDALPFLSSSAFTVARAVRAVIGAENWVRHCVVVTAASMVGTRSSVETLATPVQLARPQPFQLEVAGMLRKALSGVEIAPARIQDSYGFRAAPQVLAPLVGAIERLRDAVEIEINSSPENPLVDCAGGAVLHNGNFHTQTLALATEAVTLALNGATELCLARINNLSNPAVTAATPFLSDGMAGSSGVMVVEYVAAAAAARVRCLAVPASLSTAVISLGTEDHASFAPAAIDQLIEAVDNAECVLACELLSASRAIHISEISVPPKVPLGDYLCQVPGLQSLADRPLSSDISAIQAFIHSPVTTQTIG